MEVNSIIEVPGQTWDERQSDAELDALYAAITGRRAFSYDPDRQILKDVSFRLES